jgi:hypothetical protein
MPRKGRKGQESDTATAVTIPVSLSREEPVFSGALKAGASVMRSGRMRDGLTPGQMRRWLRRHQKV